MGKNKIIFIVGPTAVGKSEIALKVAVKVGGEIISCDSMQVYKQINIANNKPFPIDQKKIKHHVIDLIEPEDEFDVVKFNRVAVEAIKSIHSAGKIPIVVGGSGLYVNVLLDGIFKGPTKNIELRSALEERANIEGSASLHRELELLDGLAASKIHPHDTKRVIRALEVCLSENKPISILQKDREGLWGNYPIFLFAVNRPREELYAIVNKRVDEMFARGIIEEIKNIRGRKLSQTAHSIIGVKEINGYLDGEYDIERAKYLMKLNTRHLAKRQLTWFRKEKRLDWVEINNNQTAEHIVDQVVLKFN